MWQLDRGSRVEPGGQVRFRVWAPRVQQLEVQIQGETGARAVLKRDEQGMFEGRLAAQAGDDYLFVLDGEHPRPDPVSRWQPQGVHGPSRIVDPAAFAWTDAHWKGLPLDRYTVYELHIGTFTAAGTFDAALDHLDHLVALGVTAVELMPVAEFPGGRNWGYDGVHLYAPQSSYGGPEGMRRLVDACHSRNLAVVLDVVYNHLGPEGNYLHGYGPYFTDRYRTPWGEAVNYDGPDSDLVRAHVVDNARHWFHEYHVDALRLDAIHGIFDFGARPILGELAEAATQCTGELGRPCLLIAESDLNDARVLRATEDNGLGMDAQWCDDFHHALHALLTGQDRGYFADFGRVAQLGRAFSEGYVHQGEYASYRRRRHGNDCRDRPGQQFVVFVQNHDQIANACQGQRLVELVGWTKARLAATLMLSAPYLPMLFMGEEYAELAPFDYFTSHGDPGLAAAVSDGRRREHAVFDSGRAFCDPQAEATFAGSRLRWDRIGQSPHREHLAMVKQLIALRHQHPALGNCRKDLTRASCSEAPAWICVERGDPSAQHALVVANLGDVTSQITIPDAVPELGRVFCSEDPAWGGAGCDAVPATTGAGQDLSLPPFAAAIFLG
ncbi:MAG: malto-oligosyltrehalose trehalohydrolase [Pseudomonadota bacterium]